jgi:hypothetical protein
VRAKFNSSSNPSSYAKTKVNFKENNFENKELLSLVQEQVKNILKVKRQKTSHEVHNTESECIEAKEFNLDGFFNLDIENDN